MVEKAHFNSLDRDFSEDEFIKLVRAKKISLDEIGYCLDTNCHAPLEPLGISLLKSDKEPKRKGFRIVANSGKHHEYGCEQLSPAEAHREIEKETTELSNKINAGKKITLVPTRTRKPSSVGENTPSNSGAGQNSQKSNRNTGGYNGNTIVENTNVSNVGTLTNLYYDGNINNQQFINMAIDIAKVNGTTGERTLDDLFFNVDNKKAIPLDEFHIFFGCVTIGQFGKQKSALSFEYNNAHSFKVFANISKLKRTTFGNHIVKSSNVQNPILYFEGYFTKEDRKIKAVKVSDYFSQDIYMREKYN